MPVSCESSYATTSNVPPALVIFSFADALNAARESPAWSSARHRREPDRVRGAAHKAMRAKQLGSHRFARRKNVQFRQVHDRVTSPRTDCESRASACAGAAASARLQSRGGANSRGATSVPCCRRPPVLPSFEPMPRPTRPSFARAYGRLQIRERKRAATLHRRLRRFVLTTLAGPSRAT